MSRSSVGKRSANLEYITTLIRRVVGIQHHPRLRAMDARQNFTDSIEKALEVMGTGVKESIYFYLKEHSILRDEIPEKLQQFRETLRELLGYGAKVIEKLIVKAYVQKMGIPLATVEGKDLGEVAEFVNYRSKKQPPSKGRDRTISHRGEIS